MADTTFTPGPWEAEEFCEGGNVAFVRIGDITVDGSYRGGESDSLSLADARLMAAAPDLFAALQAMDAALCAGFDTSAARNANRFALIKARAALAKATGVAS